MIPSVSSFSSVFLLYRCDCEEIWRQFEETVIHQSPCNVTVEHYYQMFNAMPEIWPCDRVSSLWILVPK